MENAITSNSLSKFIELFISHCCNSKSGISDVNPVKRRKKHLVDDDSVEIEILRILKQVMMIRLFNL